MAAQNMVSLAPSNLRRRISSDTELAKIARELTGWTVVRPFSGLNSVDEETIRTNYKDIEDQRFQFLRQWKKKNPNGTFQDLEEMFRQAERMDMVEITCKVAGEDIEEEEISAKQDEKVNSEQKEGATHVAHCPTQYYTLGMCVVLASILAVSFAAGYAYLWAAAGDVSKTVSAIETSNKKAANQEGEHNLPWFPPPFIGRDENVSRITNMLLCGIRGVHITGAPAIGKSHLAVQVGYKLVKHGVNIKYIDVSEKQLLDDVGSNPIFQGSFNSVKENNHDSTAVQKRKNDLMLSWFSPQEQKDTLVSASSLLNWARGVKTATTIILDNCDDVLQGTLRDPFLDIVKKLQKASKHVMVISTSRVYFYMVGVNHFPLRGLGKNSSTDLLQQECEEFQVEAEMRTVADLVGHNPLGLRLAAKLACSVMTVNELIKNLRTNSVKTLSNEAISEKEKMQYIIETSIKCLEKEVMLCARNISLFPGSFSREAGVGILSGCGVEDAIGCLNTLTHISLLEWYEVRGESRYRYHELVRDSFVATDFTKIFSTESDGKQIFYELYSSYFTTHLVKTLEECKSELNEDCKYWIHFEEHNTQFVLTALLHSSPRKASKCHADWVGILTNPTFIQIYGEHRVSKLILQEIDNTLHHLFKQRQFWDTSLHVVLRELRNLIRLPGIYRVFVIFFSFFLMPKFRVLLQSHGRYGNSAIGVAGINALALAASLLASTTPAFYTTWFVQSLTVPIVDFALLCAMILLVEFVAVIFKESFVLNLLPFYFFLFLGIHYFFAFFINFQVEAVSTMVKLVAMLSPFFNFFNFFNISLKKKSCVSTFVLALSYAFALFLVVLCIYRVHLYSDIIFLLFPIILLSNVIILLWFVWVIGIRSFLQHKQNTFLIFLVSSPLIFFVVYWEYPFFTLFFM